MITEPRTGTEKLLTDLFGSEHSVRLEEPLLYGEALFEGKTIAVLGTWARAHVSASLALDLSWHVLRVMRFCPGRPILLIVENSGQKLSLVDELLGNNGFIAHLSTCLDAARRKGHSVIGLVHNLAVSGGFMATGMATGRCYALENAELRVMTREAMSRITRIPPERLDALAEGNPILGPGVSNFERIGAISAIWSNDFRTHLRNALDSPIADDEERRRSGAERGGRLLAFEVAQAVRAGRQRL